MTLDEKLQAMSPAEVAVWMRENGVKQLSTGNARIVMSDVGLTEAAALRARARAAAEKAEAEKSASKSAPDEEESGEELYARSITGN